MKTTSPFPPGSPFVGYLRDSGGDEQDLSIQQQERAIRAWCEQNNHPITKLFIDEARTGTTTAKRDQFLEMVLHFRHGATEAGLVIWNHRRFARNYNDAQYYKADIRRRGYIIHSLNDSFPEGTDGQFFESAYDWMAEKKSEETSYEAKRGLHDLVKQHHAVPGTPPRGFKREPINLGLRRDGTPHIVHKWVPDPEMVPIIQKAFAMRANEASMALIQKETKLYNSLNSYTTFFANPIYIGQLHYADFFIDDYCEPIIDQKTWQAVQKLRANHVRNQNITRDGIHHPRRQSSSFLLSGILHCALCGAPMSGHKSKQRNGSYYRRYECTRAKRRRDCQAKRIPAGTLEKKIIDILTKEILTDAYLAAIQAAHQEQIQNRSEDMEREEKIVRTQLRSARQKISNLTNAIAEKGHSRALIDALTQQELSETELQAKLSELQYQRSVTPKPLNLDERQKIIHQLKHQLTTTDPTEVRQVLRGIIQRIIVERQEKTIQGHITFYYPPVPVKKRH